MSKLTIQHLSFGYEEGLVLDEVDLNIDQGDFVGIIGSNGTGKSTLIKCILGLLKPDQGKVIANYDRIGYVPQVGLTVKSEFPATVREIVMMNLYEEIGKFRFPKKKHGQQVEAALDLVGMKEYQHRQIGRLSGGQQQRVLIAKALVNQPEVLILDEPTVALDIDNEAILYRILKQLNQENGLTILMVTHNIEPIAVHMNKIYQIKQKRVTLIKNGREQTKKE